MTRAMNYDLRPILAACYSAIFTAVFTAIFTTLTAVAVRADDPTDAYQPRQLEGWTLLIHQDLIAQEPERLERTLAEVGRQLRAIVGVVPEPAVEKLRQIRIWIELNDARFPCMCYHGHREWLREHGVNTDKTGDVELANPQSFLLWTKNQPWMVLHELAHGYHDRFLDEGFRNAAIAAALARAKTDGLYGEVAHIAGRPRDHYAATNPMEYFAEGSEAFFGKNDFFPYDHAELKRYDPAFETLLEQLWGVASPKASD